RAMLGEAFALAQMTEARLVDHHSGTVITTMATSITGQPKPATLWASGPKTDATLNMQGLVMKVDHYVLSMKGPDVVLDYRALNAVTVKDKFPILTAVEMFDELGGAVIFTKLDLRAGYGVKMDHKKVYAIREWPIPQSQPQVHGFLGLAGYYRQFIKGYATLTAPLTDLLRKDGLSRKTGSRSPSKLLSNDYRLAQFSGCPILKETFIVEIDASVDGIVKALDESFLSRNHVRKLLRDLLTKWRSKVTTIEESKD
nr:hypothetical protein [Tanacetum cinerariifolium]